MRKRLIVVMALILTILICAASFVSAAGLYDDLEGKSGSDSHLEDYDNYYLDMVEASFFKNPGSNILNIFANLIFAGIKGLGAWSVSVLRFALSTDIFDMVQDAMEPLFGGLKTSLFDSLSTLMIGIAAAFFVLMLARRQVANIVSGIGTVIIVLIVTFIFYTNPMGILSAVNDVSTDLSSSVLNAPYEAAYGKAGTTKSPADRSAELVWNIIVHKPWQILEFGDTDIANKYQDEILSIPEGDERTELVENIEKDTGVLSSRQSEQLNRVTTGIFFLIFSLIIFIMMMAIALLIIGFQIFAIFLGLVGGFVFLLAIIPVYGLRLIGRWAVRILSAITVKVVLVFAVAILVVTMDFVFGLLDTYGMMAVMFTLIAIVLILYIKRKSLLNLFTLPPGQAVNAALNTNFNPLSSVRSETNSFQTWQRNRTLNKLNKTKLENETMRKEAYIEDKETRKQEKIEKEEAMARLNNVYANNTESLEPSQNMQAPMQSNQSISTYSDMRVNQNSKERQVAYTKQQREAGLELLRENYAKSKEQSESKARSLGKEPEYTTFVKRTDALRAMNPEAEFDRRDVEKMARMVQRTEAAGGTVEDLRRSTTSVALGGEIELNRGQAARRFLDNRTAVDSSGSKTAGNGPERVAETSADNTVIRERRGIEYFKSNFGEEKGEKYYHSLSEKYGEENLQRFQSDRKLSFTEVRRQVMNDVNTNQQNKNSQDKKREMKNEN